MIGLFNYFPQKTWHYNIVDIGFLLYMRRKTRDFPIIHQFFFIEWSRTRSRVIKYIITTRRRITQNKKQEKECIIYFV